MQQFPLYLLFTILSGGTLFWAFHPLELVQKPIQHPNVIMIVVDDMNGYSTRDRYPLVKMPYLDRFRTQAVNFVNATCNSPVCSPSRASFFSGLYPHKTGAYFNGSAPWNNSEILQETQTIPEWFKENGYTTWGRGKIFHGQLSEDRRNAMWDNRPIYKGGFGPFPEKEYQVGGNRFRSIKAWEDPDSDFPDVKNADAAIEFLNKEHNKPFFLYYGLWRPHSPYTAPKRFFDLYDEKAMPIPAGRKQGDLDNVPELGQLLVDSLKNYKNKPIPFEELYRKFLYAYCANMSFTDWNLGRVIEALDASNYADNTIVIVFSDNGFHCGEKERWGKSTLWDQADYIPLLIRTPQTKGATSKATVSLVDVFPTLVDYCQLPAPKHSLDGQSIGPIINKPNAAWDRPGFTSYGVEYASIRTEQYRYIRYPDGTEELYDYTTDLFDFHNLAQDPSLKPIKEKLATYIPTEWAPSLGGRLEVKKK